MKSVKLDSSGVFTMHYWEKEEVTSAYDSLLSGLLVEPESLDDFDIDWGGSHATIVRCIKDVVSAGGHPNPSTVGNKLIDLYGSASDVVVKFGTIASNAFTAANNKYYAEIIRKAQRCRKAYHTVADVSTLLSEGKLTEGEELCQEILDRSYGTPETVTLYEAAKSFLEKRKSGALFQFSTGVQSLNLAGVSVGEGEVLVVGARPSHGKSLLGMQFAIESALNGKAALFLSEEMTPENLAARALKTFKDGPEESWKLVHIQEGNRNISAVEKCVKKSVKFHNISLLVVDYLQLLDSSKASDRYSTVTDVSKRLKQLCLKYKLPTVILSQCSRQIEYRSPEFVPMLADLKESGGIEQDADKVVMLQNMHRFDDSHPQNYYRLYFLKHRNGELPPDYIPLYEQDLRFTDGGEVPF